VGAQLKVCCWPFCACHLRKKARFEGLLSAQKLPFNLKN
jgi:hypothetical protein